MKRAKKLPAVATENYETFFYQLLDFESVESSDLRLMVNIFDELKISTDLKIASAIVKKSLSSGTNYSPKVIDFSRKYFPKLERKVKSLLEWAPFSDKPCDNDLKSAAISCFYSDVLTELGSVSFMAEHFRENSAPEEEVTRYVMAGLLSAFFSLCFLKFQVLPQHKSCRRNIAAHISKSYDEVFNILQSMSEITADASWQIVDVIREFDVFDIDGVTKIKWYHLPELIEVIEEDPIFIWNQIDENNYDDGEHDGGDSITDLREKETIH